MEPNQVWAYDFVFDGCANGQQLKCLVISDEWTHEALAIDVQGSIRSSRVIDVLSRLVSLHGAPRYLRSDNGPEFETWRRHYNEDRPHSSLGYRTPKQFKDEFQQQPASTHRVILN